MVSFVCDACQETLKKAKLDAHKARCRFAAFSCIDCSTSFAGRDYAAHTSCITEVQKHHGAKGQAVKNTPNATPKAKPIVDEIKAALSSAKPPATTEEIKPKSKDTDETSVLHKILKKKSSLSLSKLLKKYAKKNPSISNSTLQDRLQVTLSKDGQLVLSLL
jgi:cell growth-regulating nucleolar protein